MQYLLKNLGSTPIRPKDEVPLSLFFNVYQVYIRVARDRLIPRLFFPVADFFLLSSLFDLPQGSKSLVLNGLVQP
ncbi:unnamed protein product [Meloidogyne enterolobii]|uniref:Uncharacterized protein n=1 Tax=Meloidogyne enterolobii TaxID=390850 RepID=A0ACB0ZWE1_MELEN